MTRRVPGGSRGGPVGRRRVAVALLGLAAATGCGSAADPAERTSDPVPVAAAPSDAELLAQAGLGPCPPSPGAGGRPPLPDVTLPCLGEGPEVALAGLAGEPTVVNLWASWCGPCVDEMPALQAVHRSGALRVVGVLTQDRPRQGLAAAAGLGVTFPSVVDDSGRVLRALGLKGLPATLFVRPDGSVAHTYVGPALDEPTVRRLAEQHLGVAA